MIRVMRIHPFAKDGLRLFAPAFTERLSLQARQASREKAVLCCGNVQGVAQVHDLMTVVAHAGCSRFHRVSNGDSLPQIAEHCYGDAACWPRILDANRLMLHAPDRICSGQVLRIPA